MLSNYWTTLFYFNSANFSSICVPLVHVYSVHLQYHWLLGNIWLCFSCQK